MAMGFCRWARANITVSGPRRPENMVIIMSTLPKSVREVVMPVVRPTVPKADTVSNITWMKDASSDTESATVTTVTNVRARAAMVTALNTKSLSIRLS